MTDRRRNDAASRVESFEVAILRHLEAHPTRGFKTKELQRALRVPNSRYRQLRAKLVELARAGRIASLPRRRYGSLRSGRFLEASVEGIGQSATHLRLDDGSRIALTETAMERAVPGDRVRFRRVRDGRETLAQIDRVLRAARRRVFGVLQQVSDRWVLIPERRIPGISGAAFLESESPVEPDDDGSLAQGWLEAFDPATERPLLTEVEVLGPDDHPQAAMSLRIARSGWPGAFSAKAEELARAPVTAEVARRDLTEDFVFTIDPITAKDHDDAVSVTREADGGFVLGVHIADVAHRVPAGTALDEEAQARATSVYPPGRVLPMLPEALSSGGCSLHHGVERDTITARLHYDADGRRRGVDLGLTRIRSRASLAYEQAEALLDDPGHEIGPDRLEADLPREALRTGLLAMLDLASALRARRRSLGSLFVQRPEREFEFDEDGHVAHVHLRPNLRTHWIIEEFMLEANRAAAEVLHRAELPLLWRIHESPDERKVEALSAFLREFDIRWLPSEPVSGADYAELFATVEGKDEAPLVHLLALRSLMKARYHAGWDRHFGLAFDHYTHFTSPIRRYPDLYNQRWLHRLIAVSGQAGWIDDALRIAREIAPARLARPGDRQEAERLADHCSDRERQATRVERDCADICAADALKLREGEEMDGRIVSVLGSGLFVELEDTGLDGFVGVEQLGRDWFRFDPDRQTLVGERTGRRFRLGQRVRVLLEYVDVANGRTWLGGLRRVSSRERGDRNSKPPRGEAL